MSAPDRLTAAIKDHNERQAEANRKAAADKQQLESETHRQHVNRTQWLAKRALLANGVTMLSNRAAQSGSGLIFVPIPEGRASPHPRDTRHLVAPVPPLFFDVRKSGDTNMQARLQFSMDVITGKVTASCSIDGVALLAAIDIFDLKPEWAAEAAENVLVAAPGK